LVDEIKYDKISVIFLDYILVDVVDEVKTSKILTHIFLLPTSVKNL